MSVPGAQKRIVEAASQWPDVNIKPHRYGGLEFRLGRREEELGTPEVADRVAVAPEHVQHRALVAAVGLAVVGTGILLVLERFRHR